jgi:hypothetical protein
MEPEAEYTGERHILSIFSIHIVAHTQMDGCHFASQFPDIGCRVVSSRQHFSTELQITLEVCVSRVYKNLDEISDNDVRDAL